MDSSDDAVAIITAAGEAKASIVKKITGKLA